MDFLYYISALLNKFFFNLSNLIHCVHLVLVSDRIILEVKACQFYVLKQNLGVPAARDTVFVKENTTINGDISIGFEFMVVTQSFRESPGVFRSEICA